LSVESLVAAYGYPALFLGSLFEGETVLVIASFLAHRGYLELEWVMLVAFLATLTADQFFFYLGRRRGAALLDTRPAWKKRVGRVHGFLERHSNMAVLSFRFIYGLRALAPLVIGMSGYSARKFLILNVIGALLWVMVFGTAGYFFGQVIETLLGDVEKYEFRIALGMAVIGTALWLYRRRRLKDRRSSAP
jgi:membrane protein DedA with SNARE-associated domain